jgi:glucose/arabinose dehydrogenase
MIPKRKRSGIAVAVALAGMAVVPAAAWAQGTNENCLEESVYYNPGNGEDIIVPRGFKVEVFARGLNFPTDVAFVGNKDDFKVYILESGTGLPGKCNTNVGVYGGAFSPDNPFTPDIVIYDDNGTRISGRLGKPTPAGGGFQPDGPAIGLSFEHGTTGGTLFGTDSNQGARGAPGKGNNTSRIVKVTDITRTSATVTPVIRGLPTGDHPTEQILVKDGWLYWSQGSATNSGVTGHDNGAGGNQHDIACQKITLSQNTWRSVFPGSSGPPPVPPHVHVTSGYSNHGVARPGTVVPAYEDATSTGMCTGAILRAKLSNPQDSIEPVAWGFRNPYGIRFSPADHPLKGDMLISENGEDERGARPTNNAPDRLAVAKQNPDGTPQWHGWPDRFGFLDSTQSVFNPKGSGGDDDSSSTAGKPVLPVLAFFPQQPVAPLALEPSDVAAVGLDFVPDSFVGGIVKKHAVLVSREGDFGFSQANGTPEAGHDVELVNFTSETSPAELRMLRFAFNCRQGDQRHDPDGTPRCVGATEQAFVSKMRGINRPTTIRFGPDGAAYLVDYGAVRDPGGSDPDSRFVNPANAPLVQIPGTGTIWKISRIGGRRGDDNGDD